MIDHIFSGRRGQIRTLRLYQDKVVLTDVNQNENNLYTIPRTGYNLQDGAEETIPVTYNYADAGNMGSLIMNVAFVTGKYSHIRHAHNVGRWRALFCACGTICTLEILQK